MEYKEAKQYVGKKVKLILFKPYPEFVERTPSKFWTEGILSKIEEDDLEFDKYELKMNKTEHGCYSVALDEVKSIEILD